MSRYSLSRINSKQTALKDLEKIMMVKNSQINQPSSSNDSLAIPIFPDVPKHIPYTKASSRRNLKPDQIWILNMYEDNIRELNKLYLIKGDNQKREKKRLQELSSVYYGHALHTGLTRDDLTKANRRVNAEASGRRKKTERKRRKRKKRKTRK